MRCFIGGAVSPSDRAALAALIQARAGAGWRLIPPANYHLTLCFLGDQLPAALAELAERLRTEIPRRPGRGRALAFAPFPTPAAPLLALELVPDAALLALHTAVARCVAATGITAAASGFRPHITLARGAGEFNTAALELELSFNELCLFQSIPTPDGPQYERRYSLALGTEDTSPEGGANG